MPISACYIVKNEAKNLSRSIKSLAAAVSEIVVVDTGSTDSTVEIANSLGARVERFTWVGDFSVARNFALSKVSNDIVFFLDGDEWFVPALQKKDGDSVLKAFSSRPALEAILVPLYNVDSSGLVKSMNNAARIFRRAEGLYFRSRIHEYYARSDGHLLNTVILEELKLLHDGYAEDIMDEKMKRNIELLEMSASTSQNAEERHLAHCYLVRECYQSGDIDKSIAHLNAVLAEPDLIRKQCLSLRDGFASLIYNMLQAAHAARGMVSRAELRRKLVESFKRYIPDYRGSATIDLFFDCIFAPCDGALLKNIATALAAAENHPKPSTSFYAEVEALISRCAAQALQRRGKMAAAMEYAINSIKNTEDLNTAGIKILLGCLHGQPSEEIILFLNSQFDITNPQKLAFLCDGTHVYGFNTVYVYYLNKKIELGMSTADEYLSIYSALGKYSEAVDASLTLLNDKGDEAKAVVAENIFLAAVCSGDKSFYTSNAELLSDYAHILDAYFSGVVLDDPSSADAGVLMALMESVAFSGGIELAEKFMGLLGDKYPQARFRVMAKYCAENGLYAYPFSMPRPASIDSASARYLIDCFLLSGRHDEAFEFISGLISSGQVDDALLQALSATSDSVSHLKKTEAQALYEEYHRLHSRFVDLSDVVNTSYIFDDTDKKKARALKSLTLAQFRKQFEADAASPLVLGLVEVSEKAGELYEQRGFRASAFDCYRFALAKNYNTDKNRVKISSILKAVGNKQIKL